MTSKISVNGRANLIGALWMIAAMAAFAVEDAFIKASAQLVPVGQVLILFGLGGAIVFAIVARLRNEPLFVTEVLSPPMLWRVIFEITGRLFYVLAIALIPLSTATVILQATPLVVVAGAALVLGARVGWRRWLAIGIGLLGVLLIVQPGADGLSALTLLAVVGMLGFAGHDLTSRMAPATISTTLLGVYGFFFGDHLGRPLCALARIGIRDARQRSGLAARGRHYIRRFGLCRVDESHAHRGCISRYTVSLHAAALWHWAGRVVLWRELEFQHVARVRFDRLVRPLHPLAAARRPSLTVAGSGFEGD